MTVAALGFVVGAAIGSLPFAWFLHRLATGRDLRVEGSGNPGATNLARTTGMIWGAAALALDAGKGAVAVLVASLLFGDAAEVSAALGAVLSHVFTPWLLGRGGKGVATAAGAFAVIAPAATGAAFLVFALTVAVTRIVSLGSALAAVTLPIAVYAVGPGGRAAMTAAAIAVVIAWRHRANFARMRSGTEPRLRRRTAGRRGASS